uniref:Exoribonuclease phosphorolytic domain-containing protein n=1 Tax=Neobodo designis TaxID=312471 RepID=A0A7S1M0E1_NEODS|mmetsp:Transcript_31883/g.98655  ORF Transcript_31883/g.98655 Transcript_31883/m.98655 type:complete len:264 (+) Transcript_31883:37-828(+)
MARRQEYIDLAGLRRDGRRVKEVRDATITLGCVPNTDGSCLYRSGATSVTASVFGPRHAPFRNEARADQALFACTVAQSATAAERRRKAKRSTRQTDEMAALVTQALEPVLMLGSYPNASITVAVEVTQADGNELTACINAASLALADASVAMRDLVVSCNAGVVDSTHVVSDLTSNEVRSGCPVVHLAVTARDPAAIVMMSMDARVSDRGVDDMYAAATNGCLALAQQMQAALKAEVEERVTQRGAAGFLQVANKPAVAAAE